MHLENTQTKLTTSIPLSLYIHFPWCLNKCPYCDFNSYTILDKDLIAVYVNKLLEDLEHEANNTKIRKLSSIYFGGGTPSLIPPDMLASILQRIDTIFCCVPNIEITLEANPGTINLQLCREFKSRGINRLSIGIQSFNDNQLKNIQRIHDAQEAKDAVLAAKQAGFLNFNLDLMYGLPGQDVIAAKNDLAIALSYEPPHLSWYQLTLEPKLLLPNTYKELSSDEPLWDIQQSGQQFIAAKGLKQYEVSAYSRSTDDQCRHNINYWQYGDYIGVGAGAHGKLTTANYLVKRYAKIANPRKYLASNKLTENEELVIKEKLPWEFMLNALRLYQPISYDLFQKRTGCTIEIIAKQLQYTKDLGLITLQENMIFITNFGKNFLNDLLEIFLS